MTGQRPEAVRAQVAAMLEMVNNDRPESVAGLRDDTLTELSSWPDIELEFVPEVLPGNGCSVAGSYDHRREPPVLNVGRSTSVRRRHFTALHELGHHLQNTDPDLGDAVLRAGYARFEDEVCDLFAAQVLLPDSLVTRCFGDGTPTPGDIVSLYEESSASRAACAVRAAEHLDSFGAVVLYDGDGVVSFASARGSVYPPARGTDQSRTPLVATALRDPGRVDGTPFTARRTTISYRDGHDSDPLYGQAVWCNGYLIAVLVADHAPWEVFSPPRQMITTRQPQTCDCEVCGGSFEVMDVCEDCGEPQCQSGHCACTIRRDRLCGRCALTYAASMFPDNGAICRDCL